MQPDRVTDFCKRNDLDIIIRAHECVMDGFERFAQGQLITVFSATNYCGKFQYFWSLALLFSLIYIFLYMCIYLFRNCKKCWSNTGSRQRPSYCTKVDSSLATCHAFTRGISRANNGKYMDAGKPYIYFKKIYLALIIE